MYEEKKKLLFLFCCKQIFIFDCSPWRQALFLITQTSVVSTSDILLKPHMSIMYHRLCCWNVNDLRENPAYIGSWFL